MTHERVAICGGTFDPFHRGHLEPILGVRSTFGWERLIYLPARVQPFKTAIPVSSPFHRLAMTVLATQDMDEIDVSLIELEREGISFTVDTLEALRRELPSASFDWIIGDDNLLQLPEWKSIDRVFQLANFVVLSRGKGFVPTPLQDRVRDIHDRTFSGSIYRVANDLVPISSTDIRTLVRGGEPISHLVDPRVERYIHKHRLYRSEVAV